MSYCSENRRYWAELHQRYIKKKSSGKELIATERALVWIAEAAQEAELSNEINETNIHFVSCLGEKGRHFYYYYF